MQENDKVEFRKGMNSIFTLYSKAEPSKNTVGLYFEALRRYSLQEVTEAVNRHVVDPDSGQYLPKPADIVRNIDGNTQTQSELAWTKVDRGIRTVGSHESVCFDDPIIHAVIEDMGGWITLCSVDGKEYPFKHNEFIKRYRGYSVRPPSQVLSRLVGSTEAGNRKDGYLENIPNPVLIGDRELALSVLESGRSEKRQLVHRMSGLLEGAVKKLTGGKNEENG